MAAPTFSLYLHYLPRQTSVLYIYSYIKFFREIVGTAAVLKSDVDRKNFTIHAFASKSRMDKLYGVILVNFVPLW